MSAPGVDTEPKTRNVYQCEECWYRCRELRNQCGSCGEYNTLRAKEIPLGSHVYVQGQPTLGDALRNAIDGETVSATPQVSYGSPQKLSDIAKNTKEPARIETGIADLDYVLGTNDIDGKTGLVPGTTIVLGGEPGVGKSTILTQLCGTLGKVGKVFYASGEESITAVALRANRLGVFKDPRVEDNFIIIEGQNVDQACAWIRQNKPIAAIIDSAQVFTSAAVDGRAGSISQVVNNAKMINAAAKASGTSCFIIGHVTKEGEFAGPQTMKHEVDVSLMFIHHNGQVMLTAEKNRYGDISKAGMFNMTSAGLMSANK
jgi:DNA repair protein RadA/Sms